MRKMKMLVASIATLCLMIFISGDLSAQTNSKVDLEKIKTTKQKVKSNKLQKTTPSVVVNKNQKRGVKELPKLNASKFKKAVPAKTRKTTPAQKRAKLVQARKQKGNKQIIKNHKK